MTVATLERNALGHDKVARYGWKVTSDRGEFQRVPKAELKINHEVYQRDGAVAKILELASNWSWISCGVLVVARRGGELWVVDGQHRKRAADRRSDINELPCLIFDVQSVKQEARAFLDTNTNRKPVTSLAKFKALLAAGDGRAHFVNDAVTATGLRWATASQSPGDFKAVALALSLAERASDAFVRVIGVAAKLALDARTPLHWRVLSGLDYIDSNVEGGLSNKRLLARIEKIGIAALTHGADSAAKYYAKGGAKVYGDGMMQAINKGLINRFDFAA